MSRKDYIKIAEIFKNHLPQKQEIETQEFFEFRQMEFEKILQDFVSMLKNDNWNFQENRFREAISKDYYKNYQ